MDQEIEALKNIPEHDNIIKMYEDEKSKQYLHTGTQTIIDLETNEK